MREFNDGKLKTPNSEVVTDKNQALAVLLTKLSSARDNPLLMDNYVTKALRTVLLEFKESGELYEAYKEQIQSTLESNNPCVSMMMKSIGADPSIKKSMTDEAIDGMIYSMLVVE